MYHFYSSSLPARKEEEEGGGNPRRRKKKQQTHRIDFKKTQATYSRPKEKVTSGDACNYSLT